MASNYEETFPAMRDFANDAIALAPPITSHSVVHDNVCGPGTVAAALLAPEHAATPAELHATDSDPAMLAQLERQPWASRVSSVQVMSMTGLGFGDNVFTHSFTNFAIMVLPEPDAATAASELHRTLQPGGTAVVLSWKRLGHIELLDEVLLKVKPGTTVPRGGLLSDAWLSEETLARVLVAGGFHEDNIKVTEAHRVLSSRVWALPAFQGVKVGLLQRITRGWEESERTALEPVLAEWIARQTQEPVVCPLSAWIAVATK